MQTLGLGLSLMSIIFLLLLNLAVLSSINEKMGRKKIG
jgi:hypothetical protein